MENTIGPLCLLVYTALAFHSGMTQSDVSDYERGEQGPGLVRILALCRALGCSADYLLGLEDRRLSK